MQDDFKDAENSNNEEGIQDPYQADEMPPDLEKAIVARLKAENLITKSSTARFVILLKAVAAVLVLVSLFMAGWLYGNKESGELATIPYTGPEYLLLTYNPAGFVDDGDHVEEYIKWFQKYSREGYLYSGEELTGNGWIIHADGRGGVGLDASPVSGKYGHVSGFFIIRASSGQKAVEIASTCPHLKFNGVLELRPVNH